VGPYSSKCANAIAKLAEKYKTPLLIPVAWVFLTKTAKSQVWPDNSIIPAY
jgi:hypothetical protein